MPLKAHNSPEPVDLSVIIVNWNSKQYVRECLNSIKAQASATSCEVIIVDSASFDGCGEMLAQEHPEALFIQSQENLGFAKSNNLGASKARAPVILLLNPDTVVLDKALDKLLQAFRNLKSPGILGARLLNTDRTLQTSCVQSFPTVFNQLIDSEALRRRSPRSSLWGMKPLFETAPGPHPAEAVSGACMMMSKAVFDRVGGFSTHFFMYGEDIDLSYKVRQLGLQNLYFAGAEIVHHGGGSTQHARSAFSNVMMRHSIFRFLKETRGGLYAWLYRAAMTAGAVVRLAAICASYPLAARRRGTAKWKASKDKWAAIGRWGLGLETWTAAGGKPTTKPVASAGGLQSAA